MHCVFLTISNEQSRHLVRVPNSEQNTIEHTWEESTDTWTRIHSKPRRALFNPALVDHGPRLEDRENDRERETHSSFIDETEGTSVLRDKVSGPKCRRSLGQHRKGKTLFRRRVTSVPSTRSQSPDMEGGLSVFVSFDLSSRKDALAFAMHGQAARKARTKVSTKHLNSTGN